ncbi:MAG: tetratricopeptide repeat protein [Chloroflexi bacterium]|nr:tetratricopeptide repeat protein [Chloroflexota bacterium]
MFKRLFLVVMLLTLAVPVLAQEQPAPTEEPPPNCPAFENQSDEVRTSYYMGEGLAYLNANQLSAAELSFTCIIRVIDPNYLTAYMSRALVYARYRNYERAIKDYSRALELDENLLAAYNNRGVVYAALQDYDKAAADFDKVLQLNPDYIPGYNNRSIIYAIQRDYDAAISLLQDAISRSGIDDVLAQYRDPNRSPNAAPIEFEAVNARAYALLGIIYSARSLDNFQNYLYLSGQAGTYPDERIQSAAGALESRFTFEMRLDDGTWMLTADFSPVE